MERRHTVSPLVWVPVAAILAGAAVFAALSLGDGEPSERSGQDARPTLAAVATQPERYRGRSVSIAGTVLRTGPGRFVVERGGRQVLVVPGLRERAVRVEAGDRVRVTGTVRVIDRSTPHDQADPIPDFDGRAALVPGRVEAFEARSSG